MVSKVKAWRKELQSPMIPTARDVSNSRAGGKSGAEDRGN